MANGPQQHFMPQIQHRGIQFRNLRDRQDQERSGDKAGSGDKNRAQTARS